MGKNKSKIARTFITLECTECRKSNIAGVSRYLTFKNKKNTVTKLELKKYCRYQRCHVMHKEI